VAGGTVRVVTGGVVSFVAMGGAPSSSLLACHFSLSRHSRNMTIWNSTGKSMEKGLIGKRDCKYLSLLPNKMRNVEGSMRKKRPSREMERGLFVVHQQKEEQEPSKCYTHRVKHYMNLLVCCKLDPY